MKISDLYKIFYIALKISDVFEKIYISLKSSYKTAAKGPLQATKKPAGAKTGGPQYNNLAISNQL